MNEYLKTRKSLTMDEMEMIRREILNGIRDDEEDTSWRDLLGDPTEDPYNRKRIGDEACYLVFAESLRQR